MEHYINQFKKRLKSQQLSADERASMRSAISARIAASTAAAPRIPSPYAGFFTTLLWQRSSAFVAVLAVLVAGTGGAAFASEDALPGEAMYAVKVKVAEPFSSLVAITPSAKATVATTRAERRLKEAEVLAARGELDEATAVELATRFTHSADEAATHITTLTAAEPDEATDASTELQSVFVAHGRILDEIIDARDGEIEGTLANLRSNIAEREMETVRWREEQALALHDSDGEEAASREALASAEREADAAIEDLRERSIDLPQEDAAALDSRVALIAETVSEGKARHERGDYDRAIEDFTRARTFIGVGKRLLEAKERLETADTEEAIVEEERPVLAANEAVQEDAAATMMMTAEPMAKMVATDTATSTAVPERSYFKAWAPRPIRIDLRP